MGDPGMVDAVLNGVRLYGGADTPDEHGVYYYLDGMDGWWDGVESTGDVTQRPYASGGYPDPAFGESRTVVLVGEITAESRSQISAGIDRLKRAITVDRLGVLSVEEFGEVRHVRARQDGRPQFTWDGGPVAQFNIQLVAPDHRKFSGSGPVDGVPAFTFTQDAFLPSQVGGAQFPLPVETRRNHSINPGFEIDATGYGSANEATVTRVVSAAMSGAAHGRITFTAQTISDSGISFGGTAEWAPSTTYTASMDVVASVDRSIKFSAQGLGAVASEKFIPLTAGIKTRVSWSFTTSTTAPTDFALYLLRADLALGTIDVDAFLIEKGDTARDYFDGDTPDGGGRTYDYAGTPGASASIEKTGGLSFPFVFDAVVQSGSVTVPAVGNEVPEVVATIYGPVLSPLIRTADGQAQWFDLELLDGEYLVVDFDRRTVLINGRVSRRGAMRGQWLDLADSGNTFFFDASSYNSAARMSVAANYSWR